MEASSTTSRSIARGFFCVVLEALTGRELQQAVDGAGGAPGGFGEAPGSPAGGGSQGIALVPGFQSGDQGADAGGLARAGAAGEHAERLAEGDADGACCSGDNV